MSKDNGGSAFPLVLSTRIDHNGVSDSSEAREVDHGMTLRDYFAAKVMHAECSTAGGVRAAAQALHDAAKNSGQTVEQRIAYNAYIIADAMLAERSKQ